MARKRKWLTAKRMAMIAGTVILAGGMLTGAWSYSSAQVTNEASVTVVESKDALIGVELQNNHQTQPGKSHLCGWVINNTDQPIELTMYGDFDIDDKDIIVMPGHKSKFVKPIPEDATGGTHFYDGTVAARWEGGSAEINFTVEADVHASNKGNSARFALENAPRLEPFIPLLELLPTSPNPAQPGSDQSGDTETPPQSGGSTGETGGDGASGDSDNQSGSDNAGDGGDAGASDQGGASSGSDGETGGDTASGNKSGTGGDTFSATSSGDSGSDSQQSGSSESSSDGATSEAGGNPGE